MNHMNMTPTEAIAAFIADTRYEDLPEKAVQTAKMALTDFIGVAMAGTREPLHGILLNYVRDCGGNPKASVFSSGMKTSAEFAAMVNGAAGHALDFDDWSMATHGHPSVFLVPTLLALGEEYGFSAKELLAAYVVGFEVAAMFPYAATIRHYDQGWHITGTIGALGAAAAACSLMKLPREAVQRAIGMSCSMAAGIRANNGTMTKPLHAGNAAANGVKAARLAALGYTAEPNIIEIPRGFLYSFGFTEALDWDEILDRLGSRFEICGNEGINIKPYPACGGIAFAVDAVKELRARYEFELDEIREIELWVNPIAGLPLIHHNPKKGLEGKFSLEYATARALLTGGLKLDDFTDEKVNEPAIKALMAKMIWTEKYPMPSKNGSAEEFDPKGILLRMADGRELLSEVFIHAGMPQKPMPRERLEEKFRDCAGYALSAEKIDKVLALLNRFEELDSVAKLMDILR